jgi:hypothetical protein
MTVLLEDVLVALVVMGCAIFSVWRLLSAKLRLRVLDMAGPALGMLSERWVAHLRSRTLQRLAGGCVSCSRAAGAAVHRRNQRPTGS